MEARMEGGLVFGRRESTCRNNDQREENRLAPLEGQGFWT